MSKQKCVKFIFSHAVASNKKLLSVEFYSHIEADLELYKTINPPFCSLTWTHGDLSKIDSLPGIAFAKKLQEKSVNTIMHVGGRNFSRENAVAIMNTIKKMGIKNILALKGGTVVESDDSKCDFPYALEFLQFLKAEFGDDFSIGTSGYPIGHPASEDPIKDIGYLKKKVDAGADFVMCQGVFDLQTFKNFYKRCRQQHIDVPIIPAVYAINSYAVLKNLMNFCKVIPPDYLATMERYQDDEEAITNYSIKYVSDLITALLKDTEISIPGVHVSCFNNLTLVSKVFEKLDFVNLKLCRREN
ncbi:putative methylenetetrahydrofolate reductase [Trypoxylus dichotomus]